MAASSTSFRSAMATILSSTDPAVTSQGVGTPQVFQRRYDEKPPGLMFKV